MSHPREGTAILVRVSSVAEAVAAIRAGARLVDAGGDEELIAAIRREGVDVLDQARERALVRVGPGEVATAVAAGGLTLVDVDGDANNVDSDADSTREDARIATARAGAIAAVCAWQGAHMVRTRHVTEVRRCLDMTEAILGIRPPVWAVRGLG